jgi:hypothetical protein
MPGARRNVARGPVPHHRIQHDNLHGATHNCGGPTKGMGEGFRLQGWMRRYPRLARVEPFDFASIVLIAGLLVLALATFRDYAISNDEEVQHRYGELIVAYYVSGFVDKTVFGYKNLYLYGGLFDISAVLLAKVFPFDLYSIRHVLCALIGVGGVAATWATARLIGGARAGALAAVTLALCGVWYGGMFNHTKDIPFAAAMMAGTYFLCRAMRNLPRPRWSDLLGFGLMLGAALGLRAMGMLLIGYVFVAVALQIPQHAKNGAGDSVRFATRSVLGFMPAFVLGYLIMIAAWPWAALDLLNPVRAVFAFAHFHYTIRTIVLDQVYEMADVPRWYVPIYFLVKLPIVTLIGVLMAAWFAARRFFSSVPQGTLHRETAFILFVALFPLICQVVFQGPAFTGLRHFLFLVPPLAVLTGLGLDELVTSFAFWHRRAPAVGLIALSVVFVWTASVLVRLHPHEYLFYSPLVGGLQGAAGRYEMDYWVNTMSEAVRGLGAYLDRTAGDSPRIYTVGVCGERFAFERYADRRMKWTPGWLEADFFIAPTHMDCHHLVTGKTILSIERLGVPIGVVKDRRGFVQRELARGRRN